MSSAAARNWACVHFKCLLSSTCKSVSFPSCLRGWAPLQRTSPTESRSRMPSLRHAAGISKASTPPATRAPCRRSSFTFSMQASYAAGVLGHAMSVTCHMCKKRWRGGNVLARHFAGLPLPPRRVGGASQKHFDGTRSSCLCPRARTSKQASKQHGHARCYGPFRELH